MQNEIPFVVQNLYTDYVTEPNPQFWPEHLKHDPVQGHALWAFYQGLRLGVQLTDACLEKL
ncbi:MAG: hypothetical protein HFF52_00400 [Lawsonibacter sp.]|nr:hypothetical protein [Lawsonibacter sp.]